MSKSRAEKIKEIVGLYWLSGTPHEELQAKLSSHAMRSAVRAQYIVMESSFTRGLGCVLLESFLNRRNKDGPHCRA